MARNLYFSDKVTAEQQLYENIVIESLKMYGQDVYYLPRDIVNEDKVFGDDVPSRFNSSYKVEMYIENTEGFDGEGDLFTKFGVEIRDQATFVVARKRWADTVQRYDNDITVARPAEGDLIYLPLSNSLFQIMHVEHEQPFYQLSNLPTYKLRCELFEYNDEDLDTGIEVIDDIEANYAYAYNLTFTQSQATAVVVRNLNDNGGYASTLDSVNILSAGSGYSSAPSLTFGNLPAISSQVKFGNNSLHPSSTDNNTLTNIQGSYLTTSHRGSIEFWVYTNGYSPGVYQKLFTTGPTSTPEGSNYKNTIMLDDQGSINTFEHSTSTIIELEDIGFSSNRVIENQWNHIKISFRGSVSGLSERTAQIYINGVRVFIDTDDKFGGLIDGSYNVGGTIDDFTGTIIPLDGFIDDFHAVTTQPSIASTITVPSTSKTGNEINLAVYETFDTPTPTATATISNGVVSSITIDTNHDYFRTTPTITIDAPANLQYVVGETVQQTLASGIVISGEIAEWKSSTNEMKVIHVGADDGSFHNFITTRNVVGVTSEVSTTPSSVTEENQISENEQNDDFETISDGFLDFTETNPFGDPNES